jgi:hypothetical protein
LADADAISHANPVTASRLARSLSPRSRAHIPFITLVLDRTPQLPRRPNTFVLNTFVLDSATRRPRRPLAHQRASPQPRGHACAFAPTRWTTPARLVSLRFGFASGIVILLLRSPLRVLLLTNYDSLSSFHTFHTFDSRLTPLSSSPLIQLDLSFLPLNRCFTLDNDGTPYLPDYH